MKKSARDGKSFYLNKDKQGNIYNTAYTNMLAYTPTWSMNPQLACTHTHTHTAMQPVMYPQQL